MGRPLAPARAGPLLRHTPHLQMLPAIDRRASPSVPSKKSRAFRPSRVFPERNAGLPISDENVRESSGAARGAVLLRLGGFRPLAEYHTEEDTMTCRLLHRRKRWLAPIAAGL